jgi:hypothetical protein
MSVTRIIVVESPYQLANLPFPRRGHGSIFGSIVFRDALAAGLKRHLRPVVRIDRFSELLTVLDVPYHTKSTARAEDAMDFFNRVSGSKPKVVCLTEACEN